jgi:hypothetical protein
MRSKKVIYNGGFVEEPKPRRAEDRTSLLYGQLIFNLCENMFCHCITFQGNNKVLDQKKWMV